MNKRRSRFAPAVSLVETTLERRVVLSAVAVNPGGVEIAAHKAATVTTVAVNAGTLGQPITFTVTVRAPAAAGAPQGKVNLVDFGQVLQTLTLSPITTANARYAYSQATYTMTAQPGGSALFFGRYKIEAQFVPGGGFSKSVGHKTFMVDLPKFTTLAGGVETASIAPGTGPAIASGQTAHVLYTGYLAKGGQIFDDSADHGGTPLSYTLGSGQVIPGFDAGTVGMQVGESRIVVIPPSEGYGATANGPIPGNSTLVFVFKLVSIS